MYKTIHFMLTNKLMLMFINGHEVHEVHVVHEVALVKHQCIFDIRKYSFSRTINEWNKLSTDCVTTSSVNIFKNKVDTYLSRVGYT